MASRSAFNPLYLTCHKLFSTLGNLAHTLFKIIKTVPRKIFRINQINRLMFLLSLQFIFRIHDLLGFNLVVAVEWHISNKYVLQIKRALTKQQCLM